MTEAVPFYPNLIKYGWEASLTTAITKELILPSEEAIIREYLNEKAARDHITQSRKNKITTTLVNFRRFLLIENERMRRYFGKEENWDKPIKFEYFSVIIKGERPHIHILYFGTWLPHSWLKKVWQKITGYSEIVDIRTTRRGIDNEKKLAGYVLAQYALFQEGDIRFQMSQGWTWRGMVRDWKKAVRKFTKQVRGKYIVSFKELLDFWVKVIRSKKTKQMVLE